MLPLADAESAQLIEDLAAAVGVPHQPSSPRSVRAARQLAAARTCYDHLAGARGVALFDALRPRGRRPLMRTCLDWTERRSHLGGSLGAALRYELEHRAWITTSPQHRAVTLTPKASKPWRDCCIRR